MNTHPRLRLLSFSESLSFESCLFAASTLEVQAAQTCAKQGQGHRLRYRSAGRNCERDAVVSEVTIRIKTECDVVPGLKILEPIQPDGLH